MDQYPQVGVEVAKVALKRSRVATQRAPRAAARRSFAVVPISASIDATAFAAELAAALGASSRVVDSTAVDVDLARPSVAEVEDGAVGAMRVGYHLEEMEARFQHLLYIPDPTWTAWSHRAIRWADHVVLVASATAESDVSVVRTRALGCAGAWPARQPGAAARPGHDASGRHRPLAAGRGRSRRTTMSAAVTKETWVESAGCWPAQAHPSCSAEAGPVGSRTSGCSRCWRTWASRST